MYTTVYLFIYFRLWACLVFNLTQKSSPYRANFNNFFHVYRKKLPSIIRIIYCPVWLVHCVEDWSFSAVLLVAQDGISGWELLAVAQSLPTKTLFVTFLGGRCAKLTKRTFSESSLTLLSMAVLMTSSAVFSWRLCWLGQSGGSAQRVEVLSAEVEMNEKSEGCHRPEITLSLWWATTTLGKAPVRSPLESSQSGRVTQGGRTRGA